MKLTIKIEISKGVTPVNIASGVQSRIMLTVVNVIIHATSFYRDINITVYPEQNRAAKQMFLLQTDITEKRKDVSGLCAWKHSISHLISLPLRPEEQGG